MKWCCSAFQNRYEMAGERSIAVLVDANSQNESEFLIQARALDHGDEPEINTAVPMSLIIETGIEFCPWCGVNLRKWYGKHARELSRPGLRLAVRD